MTAAAAARSGGLGAMEISKEGGLFLLDVLETEETKQAHSSTTTTSSSN